MKMLRGLWAVLNWLFIPHGYWLFGAEYTLGAIVGTRQYKCKVCSQYFPSAKRQPTCHNIKCFVKYRMK